MKIGIYERETTPFLGNTLSGYFNVRYAEEVKDKLYAKAAVIDDGENVFAMAAVDACSISTVFCDKVMDRITSLTPIKREYIMLSATHAHTSIPEMFGNEDKGENDFDAFYIDWLAYAVADTVISAYQAREEGKIKYASEELHGICFVRNYILKNGVVRTNPGRLNPEIVEPIANADHNLPALYFENASGKPLGVVYSYGCHQDCVETSQISGDYSSQVAKSLKGEYGCDFVSIYFNGTSGNVNDVNVNVEKPDDPDLYRSYGDKIAAKLSEMKASANEITGKLSVAYGTKLYNSRVPTPCEIEELERVAYSVELPEGVTLDASSPKPLFDACMARLTLKFVHNAPKYYEVRMQVVKLGRLMLFALPGEVFTQFGERIKAAFPESDIFLASLSNNSWSYMPTKESYLPELYESLYKSARFYPDDTEDIFNSIIELGKKL